MSRTQWIFDWFWTLCWISVSC